MADEQNINQISQEPEKSDKELNELRKIRYNKLADLQAAGRDPFVYTKWDSDNFSTDIREIFDALDNQDVSIAGRIMAKSVK